MRLRFTPLLYALVACSPAEAPAPDTTSSAATPASPVADATDARAAIDAYNDSLIAIMVADDTARALASVSSSFAEDGISMQSGAPAAKGHAAIADLFRYWMREVKITNPSVTVDDVIVAGDISIETGRFAWTMTPRAGGDAINDTGKYVTIRRKMPDGRWLIIRDIGNSDKGM